MKDSFLCLLAAVLLLAACAPQSDDAPVNDQTPLPAPADHMPQPGDKNRTRGPVFLDSTDLLIMESFPPQFSLSLKGNLPTPCHILRVQVGEPDSVGIIAVDVYSLVDPAAACVQVLRPFEANIPLGSFPSGHYRLLVNGEQAAEFDA